MIKPVSHLLKLSSIFDRRVVANLNFLNKLVNDSINPPELLAVVILEFQADLPGYLLLTLFLGVTQIMEKTCTLSTE